MSAAVFLAISPPGVVDAKGGLKDSVAATTITPAGGVGENTLSGLLLARVSGTVLAVGTGSASLASGATWYKAAVTTPISVSLLATGAGGIDTGVRTPLVWYYVHLIVNPTTGAVSALLSKSATSPTMPTGYTLWRRIGSIYLVNISGGTIARFQERGSGFSKSYYWLPAGEAEPAPPRLLANGAANEVTTLPVGGTAPVIANTLMLNATYSTTEVSPGGTFTLSAASIGFPTAVGGTTSPGGELMVYKSPMTVPVDAGAITYIVDSGNLTLDVIGWTEEL